MSNHPHRSRILSALIAEARMLSHNRETCAAKIDQFCRQVGGDEMGLAEAIRQSPAAAESKLRQIWAD